MPRQSLFTRSILIIIIFILAGPALADAPVVKSVAVAGTIYPVALATQLGHPYDALVIEKDVRKLWSTGRFDDIRVESKQEADGTALVFRVRELPQLQLHEIRVEPSSFGLHPKIGEGTPMNLLRAHQIAMEAQTRLNAEGYIDARVNETLVPVSRQKVDVRLTVRAGHPVDVKAVQFKGDLGLDIHQLRSTLQAARIRRLFPPIPGLWAGWRLFPAYNPQALDTDLAHIRSLYLSKSYFDARVHLDDVEIHGKAAKITILVESGPQYRIREWTASGGHAAAARANSGIPALCSCLLDARRAAERDGVLDFSTALDVQRVESELGASPVADLRAQVEEGFPYRVGRIEFTGNHRYSDSAVRRNMVLNEGQPLDRMLLRKSIARLNRSAWFDPIGETGVDIQRDPATRTANVTLALTERKNRAWSISGPVGPLSVTGPLQASLSSRLPAWGRGLFEFSTYTASISLVAFAHPILPLLSVASQSPILPILALQRPFTPGEGWRSGFILAPQLGWQRELLGYATTQIEQRLLFRLAGDRALGEELPVTVARPQGEIVLSCTPPKPRFSNLRLGSAMGLHLLGVLSSF
jgi:outer membrane protein assembly factor BamA